MFTIALILSTYYFFAVKFVKNGLLKLKPGKNENKLSFSIVIAAKDEEDHIEKTILSVLNQDYDSNLYEVIIINDRSTDKTKTIVENLQNNHSKIKLINIDFCPNNLSPKKHALSKGIKISNSDIILFTDADCLVQQSWITTINSHFEEHTAAVSGLTSYYKTNTINKYIYGIQALDFFSHGVVSAGAIGAGMPISTNANNFAVRRNIFESLEGYKNVESIVSGDDDLLLQAISKDDSLNIRYALEEKAAVTTRPSEDIRTIWEQRKRWGSKTPYYNKKEVLFLSLIFSYYLIILLMFLLSPFSISLLFKAFFFLGIKTFIDFKIAEKGATFFKRDDLLPYFLPWAFLHIPVTVFACFFGIFGKFTWKGLTSSKNVS